MSFIQTVQVFKRQFQFDKYAISEFKTSGMMRLFYLNYDETVKWVVDASMNVKYKQKIFENIHTRLNELTEKGQKFKFTGSKYQKELYLCIALTEEKVKVNPFVLKNVVSKNDNVFKIINKIAITNGWWENGSLCQTQSVLNYLCGKLCKDVNTYVDVKSVYQEFKRAGLDLANIEKYKEQCLQTCIFKLDTEYIAPQKHWIWANRLFDIASKKEKGILNLTQSYDHWKLNEEQEIAIRMVHDNRISMITGSGGTGKTYVSRCLMASFNAQVLYLAPTHSVLKRMKFDVHKMTVAKFAFPVSHNSKMLMYGELFMQDKLENPFIVILDEASMVGLVDFAKICWIVYNNPNAQLVVMGDKKQLPPMQPGMPFADLQDVMVCSELIKNMRADKGLADFVTKPNMAQLPETVKMVECNDEDIPKNIEKIMKNLFERHEKMWYDGGNIRVITATNQMIEKTCISVRNVSLKSSSTDKYIEGQTVLMNKNTPKFKRGDLAQITQCRKSKYVYYKTVLLANAEKIITFPLWIKPADVTTVHVAQGGESDYVIFVLYEYNNGHRGWQKVMLDKRLMYTAMSRAKKTLYLVGCKTCFSKKHNEKKYKTVLKYLKYRAYSKKASTVLCNLLMCLQENTVYVLVKEIAEYLC